MANVLKKLQVNPLNNFRLTDDVESYEATKTDDDLVNWFHNTLQKYQDRPLVLSFLYAMLSYAVETNAVKQTNEILKMQKS